MPFGELQGSRVHFRSGVPLDITSNSSDSSVGGPPATAKRKSREKVSAWLRGEHQNSLDDLVRLPQEHEEADVLVRRSLANKRTYELEVAPVKHKVQCLLSFGEYSLFKKWKVLAEGDFISFRPCQNSGCQHEEERKLNKKRRKVCLKDVRTLAITKNWLLIARLYRLYQVDKDCIVPGGVALELRRLVPLRYLRVCVARPAARVIGIANQNGVLKQYQMLDKPTPVDDDPFMTWRQVIGHLRPNLNDDILYLTLNTFDRWQRQHACRLTIYPGYQNQSGISLNEWQVKLGEKEPEQCRCDNKPPAPAPPPPPPKKEEPPPPPPPAPPSELSSIEYILGCQVSVGDSAPMTASNAPSEVEGIETAFGTSRAMSEIMESPLSASGSASYSATATGDTALSMDMPPPSAGRRRKSLKALFRVGFLSTKPKRKGKTEDSSPSPDAGPPVPPVGGRMTQRRMSRLEMNEPIEDIFSEVKFETMQKRTSTSTAEGINGDGDATDDDDDIIEDPEVVLRSIMDSKNSVDDGNDDLFFHDDGTKIVSHGNSDVVDQLSPEKQLLLPEVDRNRSKLTTLSEEGVKTSDDDLR